MSDALFPREEFNQYTPELRASLEEAKTIIEDWRKEYNTQRPHSSLGMKTPAQFAADWRPSDAEGFEENRRS